MRNFLLYLGAGIFSLSILLFAAAFLVIGFLDFNNYRDEISSYLSKSLGQDVKIYGFFDVQLSFSPSVTISDMEITDPESVSNPIVRVQDFHTRISFLSLFGRPVIKELILRDAVIRLEKKDGKSNLGKGDDKQASKDGGDFLDNLPIIRTADIENVRITSTDYDAGTSFEVPINSIKITKNKKRSDINVNIGDIKSNNQSLGGLTLKAHASRKSLIVESLRQGKSISGSAEYHHKSKITSDIKIRNFPLEVANILTGNKFGLEGKLNGDINLKATGETQKSLMKSLQGNVKIQSEKVIIKKQIPYLAALNLASLNIATSGCVILQAPIEKGIAKIKGASALNIGDIKSNGTINFGTQKINVTNNVRITLPIVTANGDVIITGDLDNPKIEASDFSDLTIDGAGILEGLANKPKDAVEKIGGILGNLLGQGQSNSKKTGLRECQNLMTS